MADGRRTFSFVDLAGYTALTEVHGDESAANLADRFVSLARSALGPDDQLVKCLGDAVMLTSPDPVAGVSLVGRLCAGTDAEDAFPVVRAGLHHGTAVRRADDWFGAAVNLAARVTAEAGGGEVLVTAPVADALVEAGLPVEPLGPVTLRHISEPVELFRADPCPHPHERVVDPLCHMQVTPATAAGRLRHRGHDHWFCSLSCAAAFAADPERWTR